MFDSAVYRRRRSALVASMQQAGQRGIMAENNFNITGDNPKAIAGEISRLLQTQLERKDASWA